MVRIYIRHCYLAGKDGKGGGLGRKTGTIPLSDSYLTFFATCLTLVQAAVGRGAGRVAGHVQYAFACGARLFDLPRGPRRAFASHDVDLLLECLHRPFEQRTQRTVEELEEQAYRVRFEYALWPSGKVVQPCPEVGVHGPRRG